MGIAILILICIFILLIVLFLGSLPRIIRGHRLSKIATEFDLSFSSNYKFYWINPKLYETNIIQGNINNKQIKIYDSMETYATRVPLTRGGGYLPRRITVALIDSNKQDLAGFWGGYASPHKIKKFLSDLQNSQTSTI